MKKTNTTTNNTTTTTTKTNNKGVKTMKKTTTTTKKASKPATVTKNVALNTISSVTLDNVNAYIKALANIWMIKKEYETRKNVTKVGTPEREKINKEISEKCKNDRNTINEFFKKYIPDDYYYAYLLAYAKGSNTATGKYMLSKTKTTTTYITVTDNYNKCIKHLLNDFGVQHCKDVGIEKFIKALNIRMNGGRVLNTADMYKHLSITSFKKSLIHCIFGYGLEKGVFSYTENGYINNYAD